MGQCEIQSHDVGRRGRSERDGSEVPVKDSASASAANVDKKVGNEEGRGSREHTSHRNDRTNSKSKLYKLKWCMCLCVSERVMDLKVGANRIFHTNQFHLSVHWFVRVFSYFYFVFVFSIRQCSLLYFIIVCTQSLNVEDSFFFVLIFFYFFLLKSAHLWLWSSLSYANGKVFFSLFHFFFFMV